MHTLQWTFYLHTLSGCMRPYSCKSLWKRILYNVYTIVMLLLLYALESFLILDILFNVDNQDDFSDNLYVTLVLLSSCCKTHTVLIRRGGVENLIDILRKDPFLPLNKEETEIRKRFEEQIERTSMAYTFLLDFFLFWMWVGSFFTDFKRGRLKFRAWIPYDYSSPSIFTLTFFHQIIGTVFSTHLSIVCDCLFSSLMIHIYCQIEILEHRIRNITNNESYSARFCARHHYCIYKFASLISDEFKFITSTQFLISTGAVCFNLYRLSQIDFGWKFVETTTYTFCLLAQIFYYCWYGNEVKLKSLKVSDIVLESNLLSMDENSKKILLMIMRRANEPIEFTSFHVISMNVESFMNLLKTSYTAFNVLQQSKAQQYE